MGLVQFGVDLTKVRTSTEGPDFELGSAHRNENGEYLYVNAAEAIDAGALVRVTPDLNFDAYELDTTDSGSTHNTCGVAQAAIASGGYGWVWRGRGSTEALVATGISAGDALTTTATDGELGSGGDGVKGLYAVDANSSGSTALRTVYSSELIATN